MRCSEAGRRKADDITGGDPGLSNLAKYFTTAAWRVYVSSTRKTAKQVRGIWAETICSAGRNAAKFEWAPPVVVRGAVVNREGKTSWRAALNLQDDRRLLQACHVYIRHSSGRHAACARLSTARSSRLSASAPATATASSTTSTDVSRYRCLRRAASLSSSRCSRSCSLSSRVVLRCGGASGAALGALPAAASAEAGAPPAAPAPALPPDFAAAAAAAAHSASQGSRRRGVAAS